MFRKNNLFLVRLPGLSANSNENYRCNNFRAFADISGKFTTPMVIVVQTHTDIYALVTMTWLCYLDQRCDITNQ